MNSKPLQTLINAAREAHGNAAEPARAEPPLGFAARVVARADLGTRRALKTIDLLERLGWCGAGASAAICLLVVSLHARQPDPNPFEILIGPEAALEAQ